jgi:hypothetical protein
VLLALARHEASRVRNGYTFGDWRALRDTGDVWRRIATHLIQAMKCGLRNNLPAYKHPPLPYWART